MKQIRPEQEQKPGKRQSRQKTIHLLPYLLLGGIVLAVLLIVIHLLIWNHGRSTSYDAENVGTDFDTEELDQVFFVDEENLSGQDTDGELQVLFLGNEVLTDGKEGHRIPDLIEAKLQQQVADNETVVVRNAAVAGSRIAPKAASFDAKYPYDLVSFFYTANYIVNNDFSFFERYGADLGSEEKAAVEQAAAALRETDFTKLDMMVVMYDAEDYISGTPVFNPGNDYDAITYCGALRAGVAAIKEQYPQIRFVFMSPTFCFIEDGSGTLDSSDRVDIGNGDLTTYLIKAIDVCQAEGMSIIDNYSGTVSEENADTYLSDGKKRLTDVAREQIVAHFMRVLFP